MTTGEVTGISRLIKNRYQEAMPSSDKIFWVFLAGFVFKRGKSAHGAHGGHRVAKSRFCIPKIPFLIHIFRVLGTVSFGGVGRDN
jgi:hypothetical protein